MSENRKYSEQEIAYVIGAKESGLTWTEVTEKFNAKFGADASESALISMHHRYKNMFQASDEAGAVKILRDSFRTKRNNSFTAKENRSILEQWNLREDMLEAMQGATAEIVRGLKKNPIRIRALPGTSKSKKGMTKELLISDVHFGKLVSMEDTLTGARKVTFNLEIAKKRLKEVTDVTLKEIARDQAHYNVERVIVALLGDVIESYTMHTLESSRSCEFGNSKQIHEAAKNLFQLVLKPIAETGIEVVVPAVAGNHDRTEHDRTYNNPGEENVTYIIYNYLRDLCEALGMTNVKFIIPTAAFTVVEIYGKYALYEHGDNCKGPDRKSLENQLTSRASQLKLSNIEWIRVGHFHCPTEFGLGRYQVNGSLPGDDSFSITKGFASEATQKLNSYVDTKDRPSPFYKSLSIQLDHIL